MKAEAAVFLGIVLLAAYALLRTLGQVLIDAWSWLGLNQPPAPEMILFAIAVGTLAMLCLALGEVHK